MKILKWVGVVLVVILLLGLAGYGFASYRVDQIMGREIDTHEVDIPVPWPLTEEEIATVREEHGEEVDIDAVAMERALERGSHLVSARYGCIECHGRDFSGGVMVDDAAIGTVLGSNLTPGEGSVVAGYTTADWDRIVRHGVRRDGKPTVMPSIDFLSMSDQELSDIIVFIEALPAVDNIVPPVSFGPLGKVLLATGAIPLSADIVDHYAPHRELPPPPGANVEFGAHLAQVCAGCHGATFVGGSIPGGPPAWPDASNLTPHPEGLVGWTLEEFIELMRHGTRRDGSQVLSPMYEVSELGENMTDIELEAMFLFFQSLEPQASP